MKQTPKSDAALEKHWPRFLAMARERFDAGRQEYGDASFDRPIPELVREIQEECVDQAVWGFISFARLENIEEIVAELESRINGKAAGDMPCCHVAPSTSPSAGIS